MTSLRACTELDFGRVFSSWTTAFSERFPREMKAARDEYEEALFGEGGAPPVPRSKAKIHDTSLPQIWGAFYRPMADGHTGIELARASRQFTSGADTAAVERIAQGHGVLADVVGLDARRHVVSIRSVLDGALYHFPSLPSITAVLCRWTRVFTLLIDRGDGFWCQPSAIMGSSFSSNVTPEAFWAELAGRAARLGYLLADPTPRGPALARLIGLAYGPFVRLAKPTEEQEREDKKKRFAVTSDGDRFEIQTLELALHRGDEAALERAAEQDPNFLSNGPEWLWIGKGQVHRTGQKDEILATLREPEGARPWQLTANSPQRAARALERLTQILGRTPTLLRTRGTGLWEGNAQMASEESSDTKRLVMSTSFHRGEPGNLVNDPSPVIMDAMRVSFDELLPSMGGRPRDLVHSAEGQAKVEAWLRLAEAQGLPSAKAGQPHFLDLDPIRAEFGLPTVASTFSPPPAGGVGLPAMLEALPPALLSSRPRMVVGSKVGRNDSCPCGSGKKYKKCCGG